MQPKRYIDYDRWISADGSLRVTAWENNDGWAPIAWATLSPAGQLCSGGEDEEQAVCAALARQGLKPSDTAVVTHEQKENKK